MFTFQKKNNSKLTTREPITKHWNLANSLFFIDESISQSHLVTKHYVGPFTQICVSDPPLWMKSVGRVDQLKYKPILNRK